MEDEEGLEGFMATNDEETFWVLVRSLQGRCLSAVSNSRRGKEKENREAKRAVTGKVASNAFEKVAQAGRLI